MIAVGDLRNVEEDEARQFTLVIGSVDGEDIRLPVSGEPKIVYILNADGCGYSFRRLTAVGKGEIKVSEVPLIQQRLGDVKLNFGYGEGKVGDHDALLVLTERDEGGGHLTVRFRPTGPSPDDSD